MIFVTLGTQRFQFDRILKELDKLIEEGKIKASELEVQCVYSEYEPKHFKTFKLKPQDEIDKITDEADVIITHSGTGSIINSLKKQKKIIIIPRIKEYGEHVDSHQLELAEVFNQKYKIPVVKDMKNLYETIKNIDKYKPQKWEENNAGLINAIENNIDELLWN